jgi:hypothetical protein
MFESKIYKTGFAVLIMAAIFAMGANTDSVYASATLTVAFDTPGYSFPAEVGMSYREMALPVPIYAIKPLIRLRLLR